MQNEALPPFSDDEYQFIKELALFFAEKHNDVELQRLPTGSQIDAGELTRIAKKFVRCGLVKY